MKKILVIVPFPMSQENLSSRQDQLKSVDIGEGFEFVFRPVKACSAELCQSVRYGPRGCWNTRSWFGCRKGRFFRLYA
jgi:hypothetical protein